MSYRITPDEVRNRLRTIVQAEASDSLLISTPFIPTSEAWLDQVLTNASTSYSSLTSTKQILAKAAQIARCAWSVLNAAPKESFKAALTDFRGIDSAELESAMKNLKREWQDMLDMCGASTIQVGGSWSGGDDYQPDSEDLTNIHWTDEDNDDFSRHA